MIIFPAIDILGGKCVRLFKGLFDQKTVFADDPLEMALKWQDAGAKYLHLVDLDGARTGTPSNLPVIEKIASKIKIPIQLGGGIRNLQTIDSFLNIGITRVILGSIAVKNPDLVALACEKYDEQIVVGIDAKDSLVQIEGWGVSGNIKAEELAQKMSALGVRRIIYTDISRDGVLSGVNVESTVKLAEAAKIKVIASGGVKEIEDITNLKKVADKGIEGVIVGKAIYTGSLDLVEALKIAAD